MNITSLLRACPLYFAHSPSICTISWYRHIYYTHTIVSVAAAAAGVNLTVTNTHSHTSEITRRDTYSHTCLHIDTHTEHRLGYSQDSRVCAHAHRDTGRAGLLY